MAGGEKGVPGGLRARDTPAAAAAAAPARTRWQIGSGSFRPLCPPRPPGGAAAARGWGAQPGQAGPAPRGPHAAGAGEAQRGRGLPRAGVGPGPSRLPLTATRSFLRLKNSAVLVHFVSPMEVNMPILYETVDMYVYKIQRFFF